MPYGITITMKNIGKMKRCEGYADCASSPIKEGAIIEAKKETEVFICSDGKTKFIVEKKFVGSVPLKKLMQRKILELDIQEHNGIKEYKASLQGDVVEGGNDD